MTPCARLRDASRARRRSRETCINRWCSSLLARSSAAYVFDPYQSDMSARASSNILQHVLWVVSPASGRKHATSVKKTLLCPPSSGSKSLGSGLLSSVHYALTNSYGCPLKPVRFDEFPGNSKLEHVLESSRSMALDPEDSFPRWGNSSRRYTGLHVLCSQSRPAPQLCWMIPKRHLGDCLRCKDSVSTPRDDEFDAA